MADTTYIVKTVYDFESRNEGALDAMDKHITALDERISGVTSGLSRMTGLVMGLAAATGAVSLAHRAFAFLADSITSVQDRTESTTVAIAGMLSSAGVTRTWESSMDFAASSMAQIRRDAAALPGEAEDFITVFRSGLPAALQAGMRAADVSAFTNRFAAVGIAMGIDSAQAGRDLTKIMGGRASMQDRSWTEWMQAAVGMDSQRFNALRPEERVRRIGDAMQRYQPMIDGFQNTWSAIYSTLQSNYAELRRIATLDVFDEVKTALSDLNTWFAAHQRFIEEVARGIGWHLADAFSRAREAAEDLFARFRAFEQSALGHRLLGVVDTLGSMASEMFAENPGGAASAGGAVVGAAAGVPGLGLAVGGVFEMMQHHATEFGRMLEHLGNTGSFVVELFENLWHSLMEFEEMLGDIFAGVLPGVSSAIEQVVGAIAFYWDILVNALDNAMRIMRPALAELATALGGLVDALGSVLGPALRIFGSLIGTVILDAVSVLGRQLANLTHALAGIIAWIARQLARVGVTLEAVAPDNHLGAGLRRNTAVDTFSERIHDFLERLRRPAPANEARADGTPRRHAAAVPHHTNVHVKIEQTIHDASDPDRVLIDTRRALYQAYFHPIESPGTQVLR